MIRLANELSELAEENPFLCRILSLYQVYGSEPTFVDFWLGTNENRVTSMISRLDSQMVLYLSEESDLEETAEFIYAVGASSVLCDSDFVPPIKYPIMERGRILKYARRVQTDNAIKIDIPPLNEVFSLLKNTEEFSLTDSESFCLDISHKRLKNRARVYAVMREGKAVSCAMTVAESENAAVIGAVATDKEYRKSGFASVLVGRLCDELTAEGKTPYVYIQDGEIIKFYEKLGFTPYGSWTEFRLN